MHTEGSHAHTGDFGLSVSIRRRLEGSQSTWDGNSASTPMTGSDSGVFLGHLGAGSSGSGEVSGEGHGVANKTDSINSSGDDLSSLNSSSLSRKHLDASRELMSRDSASHDTSAVSAYHADVSVVAGTAAYAPPLSTGSFSDDLYVICFPQCIFVTLFADTVSVLCSLSSCICSRQPCTGRQACVNCAALALLPKRFAPFIPGRAR